MKTLTTISRKADASWKGDVKGGHGLLSTESGLIRWSRFSLGHRLDESDRSETNPEELLAAAAASCFSMALSKTLTDRQQIPTELVVRANVDLIMEDSGPSLKTLKLVVEGLVPSSDEEQFQDAVEETQQSCPVYQALRPGFREVLVEASLLPG